MNGSVQAKSIQVLPSHELVSTRIAEHLGDSQSLGRMLADYRARGGRIQQKIQTLLLTQRRHQVPQVVNQEAELKRG